MVSRARPVSTRICRSEWLARKCSKSCRICKVSFFLWGTTFLPRIDWKEGYPQTFAMRRSGRPWPKSGGPAWPKSLDQYNPKNDSYTFSYDLLDRPFTTLAPSHPGGQPITYTYDPNGNRSTLSTPWGLFTCGYDARDQRHTLADPGWHSPPLKSALTTFSYDARKHLSRQDNANGTASTLVYDAVGRLLQVRHSSSGGSTEIEHAYYNYDGLGRPLSKNTSFGIFTYGYDLLDQLVSEIDPLNGQTTSVYDAARRRTAQITPSNVFTSTFDAADQLLSIQANNGTLTTYSYDLNGSTTGVQFSNSRRTTYAWDAANRLSVVTMPTGGIATQIYRFDNLRVNERSFDGISTFVYDGQDVLFWNQTATSAAFTGNDTTTQGGWIGNYGNIIYHLIRDNNVILPILIIPNGNSVCSNLTDNRALFVPGSSSQRFHDGWYSTSSFTFDVNLTDGNLHQVSLYCVDWDNSGRGQTITIRDAVTNALISTQSLGAFTGGVYLKWRLGGHVKITVSKVAGPDCVVNGIFFDAPGTGGVGYLGSDTSTQGSWPSHYGGDGYNIVLEPPSYPSYATVSISGASVLSNTSDTRALFVPGSSSQRFHDCWYAASTFSVNVFVGYGQPYQLSLYMVDWENSGRQQRIDLYNADTGALLDSQTLTSFNNGVYLSWDIQGSLQIQITSLTAASAVLNGLFLDLASLSARSATRGSQLFVHSDRVVKMLGTTALGTLVNRQYHEDAQGSVLATTRSLGLLETHYRTDTWGNVLSGSAADNSAIYLGGLGYWQDANVGLDYVRARWMNPQTGQWLSVDPVSTEPRYLYAHNSPTLQTDPSGMGPQGSLLPNPLDDWFNQLRKGLDDLGRGIQQNIQTARMVVDAYRAWWNSAPVQAVLHNRLIPLFKSLLLDPDKAFDQLVHETEPVWRQEAESLASKARLAGMDHLPDQVLAPSMINSLSFMNQREYEKIADKIPLLLKPYFPPYLLTPDGINWHAGFFWSLAEALNAATPKSGSLLNLYRWHTADPKKLASGTVQLAKVAVVSYYQLQDMAIALWIKIHTMPLSEMMELLKQGANYLDQKLQSVTTMPKYEQGRITGIIVAFIIQVILAVIAIYEVAITVAELLKEIQAAGGILKVFQTVITNVREVFKDSLAGAKLNREKLSAQIDEIIQK